MKQLHNGTQPLRSMQLDSGKSRLANITSTQSKLSTPNAARTEAGKWRRDPWVNFIRSINLLHRLHARWLLSRAKVRSLPGHPRIAQRLSRILPAYTFTRQNFYAADAAPAQVQLARRDGFEALSAQLHARAPLSNAMSAELREGMSDAEFVDSYRVPFQFRNVVREALPVGTVADAGCGSTLRDLDGNWSYDLGGSYGVNLFGADFYKNCIRRAVERTHELGMVLGPYHPVVADNVRRLRDISGLDAISFHMSGTEAVMQAVRLARYHTGRSHVVRFAGSYHGWWDGVQAGPGNPRPPHEVYTLGEASQHTLNVLRACDDIACVLVNPIQAMHLNGAPPSDATLIGSGRTITYDRTAYANWLRELRAVCTERRIVLIFDEVFLGFRLARGGVQEYFGVQADLVTYGKTLGGGLPVGVLAGKGTLMRRFNDERPGDVCFARGTFNAHPYVMTAMNEFLKYVDSSAVQAHYATVDATWNARAEALNLQLAAADIPVRVANMTSVWSTLFLVPSRYNWLLQYYLRAEGLSMSWIGTGRFIFSHTISDADMNAIRTRFVSAALRMQQDGWWYRSATLTNKSIKRQVLREVMRALRGDRAPSLHVSLGQSTRP